MLLVCHRKEVWDTFLYYVFNKSNAWTKKHIIQDGKCVCLLHSMPLAKFIFYVQLHHQLPTGLATSGAGAATVARTGHIGLGLVLEHLKNLIHSLASLMLLPIICIYTQFVPLIVLSQTQHVPSI